MLGQKRNASLFAAPEAPLDTVVSVPVPSESIGGTRGELVPAREADSERIEPAFFAKNASASHSLFFTPEDNSRDFPDVCREVQGYIAANYSSLMTGSADSREQIKRYAAKYIQDKRIAVKGMTTDELVDAIYAEMARPVAEHLTLKVAHVPE